MCGIAGILELAGRAPEPRTVVAMNERLRHRGPDGQGEHCQSPVALGHRRLSIIDLATGSQPMSNEDGQVWITYNGELYNYREMRTELKAAGHVFRSESDTEVIIHAWEQWGEACVERFRGMFAFAIADYRQRVLFLARDHLGIKPLYYFQTKDRLAFASELQALRCLPDCPGEIDSVAIDNYMFLLYVPPPRTIYKGVSKLPPAHRITVSFDGHTTGPAPYWKLSFNPEAGCSATEWSARLERVLRESVRAHLVSDVPFGAFLSGGIDSTAIVAMMSEELSRPVETFSIGFDELDFSEVEYARQVASRFGTSHHEEIVRPDAVSILPELVRHYGEPFGDSSAIPTYYVSRLARRHVPMVLTGDGGDEGLLGYTRYFDWYRWVDPTAVSRPAWKSGLRSILAKVHPSRYPTRRSVDAKEWLRWVASMKLGVREHLWRPEFRAAVSDDIPEIDAVIEDAKSVSSEQYGQYIDFRTYLPHDILTKVDIASMCHGLETRTPLTDVRVAEFCGTIPWQMNMRPNHSGEWTGKHLLKQIVAKYMRPDFIERKKAGFGVPLNHWFAEGGALRAELVERFNGGHARIFNYLSEKAVRNLVDRHATHTYDVSQPLWQLLFLENWLEQVHGAGAKKVAA